MWRKNLRASNETIHSYSGYRHRTVAANAPFGFKRAGTAFRDYFCRDDRLYRGEVLPIGAVGSGITVFALAYALPATKRPAARLPRR